MMGLFQDMLLSLRCLTFLVILGFFVLTGCASKEKSVQFEQAWNSTVNYTKNECEPIINSGIIKKPIQEVWKNVSQGLYDSKDFTVIYVSEKDKYIKAFFDSDFPNKLIDCGITERLFSKNHTVEYRYPTAASSSYLAYKGEVKDGRIISRIRRETSLKGKVSVLIQAVKEASCKLTVVCDYTLIADIYEKAHVEAPDGEVKESEEMPKKTFYHTFHTNRKNNSNWGVAQEPVYVECCSNGVIERFIIKMAMK